MVKMMNGVSDIVEVTEVARGVPATEPSPTIWDEVATCRRQGREVKPLWLVAQL